MSISIIPQPAKLEAREGVFRLQEGACLGAIGEVGDVGIYAQQLLEEATGFSIPLQDRGAIELVVDEGADLPEEGYRLSVQTDGVRVEAAAQAGLFYGVQTLRQLLPAGAKAAGAIELPCVQIEDAPRFAWRGLHLDVCRHFFGIDFIKRYLDWMAQYKYNVFHWHLTEDQGWRLAVPKYPKLADISAWRTEKDGTRHGGFYTREQVSEVVEYARRLHIAVVPEIELPGHAQAAVAAYPEYACASGPFAVVNEWGVFDEVFCAGNDATFSFLEDVFEEVLSLFPGDYVHIGGDECPKTRWKECPKCQQRMRDEGLKNEEELQSYFVRYFATWLAARGKKPIGWDEILEGGLAKEAAVMSWRGEEGGIEAANAGHDVVMVPESHVYFDRKHYDAEDEPGRLSVSTLENTYSYEPVPAELVGEKAKHVLGSQGNMWTEGTVEDDEVANMVYPRACALAEVVWSPKEARDWDDFKGRLKAHGARLEAMGIAYYRDKGIWQ
ncbi:MAG: hexosaminidase [Candidatus Latescibacterota bacterium]|jgi:hexosaminidase